MKVVVLGGGAIGCLASWRLAQRGFEVTLVERGAPGGEASSAAAGILAPQAEAHEPGPLFQLSRRSLAMMPALVEELREFVGIDVGFRRSGTLVVADEPSLLLPKLEWQRAAGLAVELLDEKSLRALEPGLHAGAALRLPDDHQLEPRLFARALAAAAAKAGVQTLTSTARRLLHDGERVTGLEHDGGALECGRVVLAAGAWSTLVDGLPPLPQVVPLRGQLLELKRPVAPLSHVVFGDGGYLVPRGDGRVVVGSSEEAVGYHKAVTADVQRRLSERAARLCPSLAGAEVLGSWSGLRPATADRLPLLGPAALPGLIVATGHFRNGILLAPVTAEIVCACVAGEPPPVELAPFSPSRS